VKFPIFELERVQSLYENTVDCNLTESGFHPFTLGELLTPDQLAELHDTVLGYGQTNGSVALRERIAALYTELNADNVLVTNGSSEANFVVCHTLLEPGDEVVMMVPNYMQIWGIAEEMGAVPIAFHLREEDGWAPDLDELRRVVGERTRLITVCNPNNPTGHTLAMDDMREIVATAERVGAWVHADEVYRGAELDGVEIESFVGLGDRVIATGGLSKAYALPGLRLGWLAGPAETIATSWAYRDYTSISELLRFIPPKAGGMAFMHYDLDINSSELSDWLRTEYSVFILAGDCYGMDHYFRIGIGTERTALHAGLERVSSALKERFGV
jgi:aspartate/methionine/tyrosine aminotransferase